MMMMMMMIIIIIIIIIIVALDYLSITLAVCNVSSACHFYDVTLYEVSKVTNVLQAIARFVTTV
jgi:hypothetical protein